MRSLVVLLGCALLIGCGQSDDGQEKKKEPPKAQPLEGPACPTTFKELPEISQGDYYVCHCTKESMRRMGATVYGSGVYDEGSEVCLSGQHSGVIPRHGGTVKIATKEQCGFQLSSTRNNVTSRGVGAEPHDLERCISSQTLGSLSCAGCPRGSSSRWDEANKPLSYYFSNEGSTGETFANPGECPEIPPKLDWNRDGQCESYIGFGRIFKKGKIIDFESERLSKCDDEPEDVSGVCWKHARVVAEHRLRLQKEQTRVEPFAYLHKFKRMNDLKQEDAAETFPGWRLKGQGKISDVSKCGLTDKSSRYGEECVKVKVDKGKARVVLYFSESKKGEIMELSVGERYSFDNCKAISVKDWGFWATATCDMPRE